MKPRTLLLALGAAHLALCSPVSPSTNNDRSVSSHQMRNSKPESPLFRTSTNPSSTVEDIVRPLSRHRIARISDQHGLSRYSPDHAHLSHRVDEVVESRKPTLPCHGILAAADRNDTIIVMLVVAFLLAVVIIEGSASVMKRRRGAIRLEGPEKLALVEETETPECRDGIGDEKCVV
ncbi:hypothetical protein VTJ04DRAFT_2598 [Mycothermus thermophilus]|uniref:uncharacterized protein n=1 Tax=Humicola insolens TaxID=85995 RepID=UPI0037426396